MSKEKTGATELMLLGKKLFPQFTRAFDAAIEDIEDIETLVGGNVVNRIFRAIKEGYHLVTEIARRAGVEKTECEKQLEAMVKAGVLRVEAQGGKTEGARGARKMLYFRGDMKAGGSPATQSAAA